MGTCARQYQRNKRRKMRQKVKVLILHIQRHGYASMSPSLPGNREGTDHDARGGRRCGINRRLENLVVLDDNRCMSMCSRSLCDGGETNHLWASLAGAMTIRIRGRRKVGYTVHATFSCISTTHPILRFAKHGFANYKQPAQRLCVSAPAAA